ncbi:resolvase [Escherichia coli]|nr:resolvase [Escherichia coli]
MQHSIKHRASTAHPDEDDLVDTTCTHKNLLTERCEINRIPATGRSCAPSEERKLLLPSTSQGFLPAVDLSDGGPFTASRDSCPGADAKFLAGFMAKNFVAGASHPGQMEREGVTSAPRKVHSGKQAAGVVAGGKTAAPSGAVSSHTVRCAGSAGHGATGAARPERSLQAGFSRIGP